MSNELLSGVCCQYCQHFEQTSCPVTSASNWSRWQAFCFKYEPNGDPDARSFKDAVLELAGIAIDTPANSEELERETHDG